MSNDAKQDQEIRPDLSARSLLERQTDELVALEPEEREGALARIEQEAESRPDGKYFVRALRVMLNAKLESARAGVVPLAKR